MFNRVVLIFKKDGQTLRVVVPALESKATREELTSKGYIYIDREVLNY